MNVKNNKKTLHKNIQCTCGIIQIEFIELKKYGFI